MNPIKALFFSTLSLLLVSGVGQAQVGNLGGFTLGTAGSFTSNSLTMPTTMVVSSSSGTLASEATGSDITLNGATIGGLSSTPAVESVSNYLTFSTPGILSTTGDNNRFVFNLTGLTETNYLSQSLGADFTATGTLLDTQANTLANASLLISFSGAASPILSLGVQAAPEPSTWAMLAGSMVLLVVAGRQLRLNF